MLDKVINSTVNTALENALSASTTRRDVIANNIANVNTPGFRRGEVEFEEMLSTALGDGKQMPIAITNGKHIDTFPSRNVKPVIKTVNDENMRYDGNNVDIEREVADMAKNSIYYNSITQMLGQQYSGIKTILSQIK